MQSYTRHQLKEDKFQEVTRDVLEQVQAHRQQLTLLAVVILALVVGAGAFGFWRNQQDDQLWRSAISLRRFSRPPA